MPGNNMISLFGQIMAVIAVAVRRLWVNRWLSIAGISGFMVVAALAFSVPLYADAVYKRILEQDLGVANSTGNALPPFALLFRYVVSSQQPATLSALTTADQFINRRAPALLRLPRKELLRYFQTSNFGLYRANGDAVDTDKNPQALAPLTAISRLSEHIDLMEGKLPADPAVLSIEDGASASVQQRAPTKVQTGAVEVLVSKTMADKLGMQVGDRYLAVSQSSLINIVTVPVVIAGIWSPRDAYEAYWFYRPDLMDNMLLVMEQPFIQQVAPYLSKELIEVTWYGNFDGASVRVWDVAALIARIRTLAAESASGTLNLNLSSSPLDRLMRYQDDSQALMVQLYTFSTPLFVLAFAFMVLVAGLMANRHKNDVAVLRSRGATAWQTVSISLAQACVMGVLGILGGAPIALVIAQIMGRTRSFLTFAGNDWIPVTITPASLPFGLLAVSVTVALTVLPTIEISRHTIVSYKQERARSLKPPFWQRMGLDLLLLIPVGYWTYLLAKQGTVDIFGLGLTAGDPFANPSLFLLPALSMLALILIFIRVLPLLLRVLAWGVGHLPGASLVLAMRELARSPSLYATPVLLLSLTLALATYNASLAATLDVHLDQQTRYDVGGDTRLVGTGQDNRPVLFSMTTTPAQTGGGQSDNTIAAAGADATRSSKNSKGPSWLFTPVSDYLKAPGVIAATRVGNYAFAPDFGGGGPASARFLGIDRADFSRVAYWRKDFAAEQLGALMNALSNTPDGILIPESVMQQHMLQVGDVLRASVTLPDANAQMTFKIVGSFKLWPTWYPNNTESGPLYVGNLDYLFDSIGGQQPYDVWLRVREGTDRAALQARIRELDHGTWDFNDVRTLLGREQARPQRQGLLGMLSTGFGAAALLTVMGFLLYAAFSLQRRFIELGVLRALGLSQGQMTLYLGWELALLAVVGVVVGTATGVLATRVYVAFLQGSVSNSSLTLPFAVLVDWSKINLIYALFAVMFSAVLVVLLLFARRLKIFQAVKLGETE
jgi:putative ABC transport system permease protein